MLWRFAVERLNDCFGLDGHFMNGAIAEIGDLFGMAESPIGVNAIGAMAGIGGSGRVAVVEGGRHFGIVERTGETAVANTPKPTIPIGFREPDFKVYFGII